MTLNLRVAYDAHHDDDGYEAKQFTDIMNTLRPSSHTRVRTKFVRTNVLVCTEVGLVNNVVQHVIGQED